VSPAAVVVRTAVDAFDADLPHQLFQRRLPLPLRNRFVVTRDGQRFLVNTTVETVQNSTANGDRQLAGVGERRSMTGTEGTRLAETRPTRGSCVTVSVTIGSEWDAQDATGRTWITRRYLA